MEPKNNNFKGFPTGTYNIITSHAGAGKSMFMYKVAEKALKQGKNVMFVSHEAECPICKDWKPIEEKEIDKGEIIEVFA